MAKDKSKIEVLNRRIYGNWTEHKGDHVALQDQKTGRTFFGQIRIKAVSCGKSNCTKCPHHIYAYAQYRQGNKVKEKYLGIAR